MSHANHRPIRSGALALALLCATGLMPAAEATGFVRVSPRDPRYLELSDGRPYIPIGLNLIHPWGEEARQTATGLAAMERWMTALAKNKGNYLRIWASQAFWNVEHAKAGTYDGDKATDRLDRALGTARRLGLRVKITLEHFREIDEKRPHQSWNFVPIHHRSNGGTASSVGDWLQNRASRSQFVGKLEWYAKRWADRPEIYAIELWNEMECVAGPGFQAWTAAMLPEVRRCFPQHLAVQSLGSLDDAGARKVYREITTMAGNDVAQVHRYLDLRPEALPVVRGPTDLMAADAIRELAAFKPGRPIILAETGGVGSYEKPGHTGPFVFYAKDKDGMILHDVLFAPFLAGAAGPGQNWHWNSYVDPNDLWWHFDRFATFVEGLDPPSEGFVPSMIDHERLRVYLLQGRRTSLLWCRDSRNTWKSELEEGKPAERIVGASIATATIDLKGRRLRVFDPWGGRWSDVTADTGAIRLPAFTRSICLRLDAP